MTLVGYARVSSVGQSLEVPLDKLKHYDKIYQLDQNINTHDATNHLLFNVLGALAQFETEIRAKRQMDGIQAASSYR
jgi:DNA invertase Pin-like site-specific DNA recombinase